jgi:hypothetical protein
MTSSNYQLPAIAAVAGLAIAASTLALTSSPRSVEQRRRKRRIKSKLQRGKSWLMNYPPPPCRHESTPSHSHLTYLPLIEREGKYILGLINSGNSCFLNSVLQVRRPICSPLIPAFTIRSLFTYATFIRLLLPYRLLGLTWYVLYIIYLYISPVYLYLTVIRPSELMTQATRLLWPYPLKIAISYWLQSPMHCIKLSKVSKETHKLQ